MEVKEAMMKRRSVRKFTEEPVSRENLDTLLHYGMSGPSACNRKPWEFYVVENPEKLAALRAVHQFSHYVAPVMIIVAGNRKRALAGSMNDFWIEDCSAAIENILLGAVDLGLGACWEGLYPMKRSIGRVATILGLEEPIVPLGMIALGHPDETPAPRDQYDEKRVHFVE